MSLFALSIVSIWCVDVTSAVRITHEAKGVSFLYDANESVNSSRRRLISGSASSDCASTGGYSSNCIATNPEGCGCEALTASEKQEILDLHNARRNMAASGVEDCALDSTEGRGGEKCPAASDMNYLFWDTGLEALSTFWAHQCIGAHHSTWNDQNSAGEYYLQWYGAQQSVLDKTPAEKMYYDQCKAGNCKAHGFSPPSGSQGIGENLAYKGTTSSSSYEFSMDDILEGVNGWYDESKDYVWSTGQARPGGGEVGHWTQGVWAKSRYLGCGYAICPGGASNPFDDRITEWLNVVCKYYPAGNYELHFDPNPYTATVASAGELTRRLGSGGFCSECESDRQGCIASVSNEHTAEAVQQSALCGGPQCSACAVDFNQKSCKYGFKSCPSKVFTHDGTEGPAMHPTSRPVAFSGEPTVSPTAPAKAVAMPEGKCSLHLSGFSTVCRRYLNGEWPYAGEHNGKPYYSAPDSLANSEHTKRYNYEWHVYFSENCGQYVIYKKPFDVPNPRNYATCRCGSHDGAEVSTCTAGQWHCGCCDSFDSRGRCVGTDYDALATAVVSCDSVSEAAVAPQLSDNFTLIAPPTSPVTSPPESAVEFEAKLAMARVNCSGSQGGCECPDVEECTLDAAGKDAAKNGHLVCGANDLDVCRINCVGEGACGGDTQIRGPNGQNGTEQLEMWVLCKGKDACSGWTVMDCGQAEVCRLRCEDEMSCKGMKVNAHEAGSFECMGWCDDVNTDTDASVLTWININMGTDAEKAALMAAVALIICAALLMMVRGARKCMCRETRYAKVQLHEDSSEAVTQSEAEEILHASD